MVSRSSRTEPTSQAKRCVHRVRGEFAAFVRFFPRKQDANLRGHTHTHIQAHTHSQIVAYNAPITAVAPALHARQYLACSGHRWVNLKARTWRVYFDFPVGRRDCVRSQTKIGKHRDKRKKTWRAVPRKGGQHK